MAMSENRARLGGPIPKFKDYHIWKAMYCLSKSAPIGRKKLATLVGVGEGSTRTILTMLQESGAISVKKNGVTLTPEGKKIWASVAMNITTLRVDSLTIGAINCAVQVPRAANKVKFGCEERDNAIKSGAAGATTLIYSNGILMFPGNEYPLDIKSDKAVRAAFNLSNDDAIIIGTADTPEAAEEGAVSAGLELL